MQLRQSLATLLPSTEGSTLIFFGTMTNTSTSPTCCIKLCPSTWYNQEWETSIEPCPCHHEYHNGADWEVGGQRGSVYCWIGAWAGGGCTCNGIYWALARALCRRVSNIHIILWTLVMYVTRSTYQSCGTTFLNHLPTNYEYVIGSTAGSTLYNSELSQTCKAETSHRVAREKHDSLLKEVVTMQLKMWISRWWQPSDIDYMEAMRYVKERKYHCVLDNLQKLVIQHLFELNKLNVASTGTLIPSVVDSLQ